MYINLIRYYADYFLKNEDGFSLLFNGVAIATLSNLYHKFIREGEISPMNELPQAQLQKYIEVSEKYPHEKYNSEKVKQSAYVLELITSTE